MRRLSLKALAFLGLIVLVTAGVGLYYAVAAFNESSGGEVALNRFDDCPAYPANQEIFLATTRKPYSEASRFTQVMSSRMKIADGESSIDTPINNFIDEYIFGKMDKEGIRPAPRTSDPEFIRRVYMDLIGRGPSADEVVSFLENEDLNKRSELITQLMSTEAFIDRMTVYFADLFGNTFGLLYQGRNPFHWYLRRLVQENKPYNQIAQELLTSAGDNYENGPVNFIAREASFNVRVGGNSLDTFDQLAIQSSKVFLGTSIQCISCHSGVRLREINRWLGDRDRGQLWGMAAFFSGLRIRSERVGQSNWLKFEVTEGESAGYNIRAATGGVRPSRTPRPPGYDSDIFAPTYIFTGERADQDRPLRRELVRMMIADPQFAKAAVNYLWKQFMVLAIVEPPSSFDFDNPDQNTHPELLNALASEFQANDYNIRHVISLILNSNAYQLSARYEGIWEDRFGRYFARHFVKRLSAEQVHDTIAATTGVLPVYNMDIGRPVTINWATQLPDPTANPNGVAGILNLFERGDRIEFDRPRPQGSIFQTNFLMNNAFVVNRTREATNGSLVQRLVRDGTLTNEDVVTKLFLASLSRYPTSDERTVALDALNANRSRGAEDVQWALINKLDFLFY